MLTKLLLDEKLMLAKPHLSSVNDDIEMLHRVWLTYDHLASISFIPQIRDY